MDHLSSARLWLNEMDRAGVQHEIDCPFMAWLAGVDTNRPLVEVLTEAPDEPARMAVLRIYEIARDGLSDAARAALTDILRAKGASDAVVRWAR